MRVYSLLSLLLCLAALDVRCVQSEIQAPVEVLSHQQQRQLQQEVHQTNQQQQQPHRSSLGPKPFTFETQGFRMCPLKNLAQGLNEAPTIPFYVPQNDEHVGASICREGNFEEYLIKIFLSHIKPGSAVVDAGSNIGSYAVQFAHKTGSQGMVYAFEPQPMVYQLMQANALFGGLGNIKAHHTSLGFRRGKAFMGSTLPDGVSKGQSYEDAVKQGSVINYGGRSLGGGGEVVPMRTLDSYNITNLSFIKIDVQGSENLLIWGGRETILRERPVVNIELAGSFTEIMTHPDNVALLNIPPEVVNFRAITWLKEIGYEVVEVHKDDTIMVYKAPQA